MNKITQIVSSIGAVFLSLIAFFFYAKKEGKKTEQLQELKQQNETLNVEIQNAQKINKVEQQVNAASPDDVIAGLQQYTDND